MLISCENMLLISTVRLGKSKDTDEKLTAATIAGFTPLNLFTYLHF